jgi:hypothetical protein
MNKIYMKKKATDFYELPASEVLPCADDIDDFDKFYRFVNLCAGYNFDDSRCLYLDVYIYPTLPSLSILIFLFSIYPTYPLYYDTLFVS